MYVLTCSLIPLMFFSFQKADRPKRSTIHYGHEGNTVVRSPLKTGSHGDTSKRSQLIGGRFSETFYIWKDKAGSG